MSRSSAGFLVLVAALAAAGCASRADYEKVRRDQQEMRAMLADTQVAVDKVNRRLDTMHSDVKDRGGGAETKELDRRLSRLEARLAVLEAGGAQPVTGTTPAAVTTAGGPPAPRTEAAVIQLRREDARLAGGGVNEAYRRALDLYRQGKSTEAIDQFRQFIRSAGATSDLADDAQYWIGESYYHVQDFNRAIIELNEVLLKHPKGDRVPAALLALATAFADSGDKIDARLLLQKLVSDHPDGEETSVGRKQLEELTE